MQSLEQGIQPVTCGRPCGVRAHHPFDPHELRDPLEGIPPAEPHERDRRRAQRRGVLRRRDHLQLAAERVGDDAQPDAAHAAPTHDPDTGRRDAVVRHRRRAPSGSGTRRPPSRRAPGGPGRAAARGPRTPPVRSRRTGAPARRSATARTAGRPSRRRPATRCARGVRRARRASPPGASTRPTHASAPPPVAISSHTSARPGTACASVPRLPAGSRIPGSASMPR